MSEDISLTAIALEKLPIPDAIEALDFETILEARKADFLARHPVAADMLELESEPIVKLLEESAYRELVLRQRINELAKSLMLAYATGGDLDHIGATPPYRVYRQLIDPGDPDANPPRDPVWESDADFRRRIQLAPERFTTAGSYGAYFYHALSADPQVFDVGVQGDPETCEVHVYVLGRPSDENPTGAPSQRLLEAVEAALDDQKVRPLTDLVLVHPAAIVEFDIIAKLTTYPGPDAQVVLAASKAALDQLLEERQRLGYDIVRSALFGALHQPGVQRVELVEPAADLVISFNQAARCRSITVTLEGTAV